MYGRAAQSGGFIEQQGSSSLDDYHHREFFDADKKLLYSEDYDQGGMTWSPDLTVCPGCSYDTVSDAGLAAFYNDNGTAVYELNPATAILSNTAGLVDGDYLVALPAGSTVSAAPGGTGFTFKGEDVIGHGLVGVEGFLYFGSADQIQGAVIYRFGGLDSQSALPYYLETAAGLELVF